MDFFPSSALEATRHLPDAIAAEQLATKLNWDYPDIDNFREIVYRCPTLAEPILEKARTREQLKHQLAEWERVPCEGEQFQKLCAASEEERNAAAVMVSLLPQASEEKTRQSILLVLAELRHRPDYAASLACRLWTEAEARYWLKELIYSLWFVAPEKIPPSLEALWAVWEPYGCHYYRSETHDLILARIKATVDSQEVDRYIPTILFLTKKRGFCHNDEETVEYILTNLHRFPEQYQPTLMDTILSYTSNPKIQKVLLENLMKFSEDLQAEILQRLTQSIAEAMESGYEAPLPENRGLSRIKQSLPESTARTLQTIRLMGFLSRVYFLVWDYGFFDLRRYHRYSRWLNQPWPEALEKHRTELLHSLRGLQESESTPDSC